MNRFKFQAYLKEFPALSEILIDGRSREARHCDGIKVARLGRELLAFTPEHTTHDGSMCGIDRKEEVSFVLNDGTVIQDAVRQEGEHGSNYAYSQTLRESGESILEAIDRHGVAADLSLIVVVRSGFTVREHYSEPNFTVAVYKAAKGESIIQMIEEAANAALNEVRAEANF